MLHMHGLQPCAKFDILVFACSDDIKWSVNCAFIFAGIICHTCLKMTVIFLTCPAWKENFPFAPRWWVLHAFWYHIIFRQSRSCSASDSAYSYTFPRSVVCLSVCLSVVCQIRAHCLNRSTDLDAIWQAHLWGPMTHSVRWESLNPREGEI